jgi:Holliday junction DNA helicase RuvB
MTRRTFEQLGIPVTIYLSYGATEAKVPAIADAVVEVTETGSTLRRHGMKIIDVLLVSTLKLIAKETAGELVEQLAQNISTIEQMRGLLMEPKDGDILFLDEIHELGASAQTTLYRAMENGEVFLDGGNAKGRVLKVAKFTIVGATTDEYKLLKPLRDRFKLVLPLTFYSEGELAGLIRQRVRQLGWAVEDETLFSLIAQRGRGTPRIALKILESAKRYARSVGEKIITVEHFTNACSLEGLDSLGLGPNERMYLRILAEVREPVRLNVLASRMGLPKKTLTDTMEGFLLRIGLIVKSDKGVMVTPEGLTHLRDNQPPSCT